MVVISFLLETTCTWLCVGTPPSTAPRGRSTAGLFWRKTVSTELSWWSTAASGLIDPLHGGEPKEGRRARVGDEAPPVAARPPGARPCRPPCPAKQQRPRRQPNAAPALAKQPRRRGRCAQSTHCASRPIPGTSV